MTDKNTKLGEINKFAIETNEKLGKALTLMMNITAQHQNFDNLIKELVSDNPVLDNMLKVAGDFDPSDDKSADEIFQRLRTVLETVCSVLKLDAISYESELLKKIVERVK